MKVRGRKPKECSSRSGGVGVTFTGHMTGDETGGRETEKVMKERNE